MNNFTLQPVWGSIYNDKWPMKITLVTHLCSLLISCPEAPAVFSSDSRSLFVFWQFSPGTLSPSPSPPPGPPAPLQSVAWPRGHSDAPVWTSWNETSLRVRNYCGLLMHNPLQKGQHLYICYCIIIYRKRFIKVETIVEKTHFFNTF